ncbi:hypothetical protein E2C01_088836 [Portunus trituberculatus]|uniref:Uncharacterized protein n=1 Tax=Portunus trituberculatus TaxID=210409 RepID=A0A5B7JHJ7_PORTR|nr:hypothetical protein [Portunus trituberculatus]
MSGIGRAGWGGRRQVVLGGGGREGDVRQGTSRVREALDWLARRHALDAAGSRGDDPRPATQTRQEGTGGEGGEEAALPVFQPCARPQQPPALPFTLEHPKTTQHRA